MQPLVMLQGTENLSWHTSKFTLIYKFAIQFLLLLLQGVQIFQVRNMKLTSGEPYVLITKI